MIHYFFIGATWLIGAVGVGGAIAVIAGLVFLGPAAVVGIVQPILARFLACRWCIAVTAALLATVAAFWIGHHTAVLDCRADALAQELAIKNADLDNATKAKNDATQRASTIEAKASDQHSKDAAYIAALTKRPSCALDSSDIGTGGMRNYGFHLSKPSAGTK